MFQAFIILLKLFFVVVPIYTIFLLCSGVDFATLAQTIQVIVNMTLYVIPFLIIFSIFTLA